MPFIGNTIVKLIWGGFSIANPTLTRFCSLHYSLPFVAFGLIIIHVSLVHVDESSSADEDNEYIGFGYFYLTKDIFVLSGSLTVYFYFVFFYPNYFSHPANYIIADITVTPRHLVPEWYFWPFYAVLRSTPDKFGGLVIIVILFVDIFLVDTVGNDEDSAFFWELVNDSSYYAQPPGAFSLETEEDAGVFIVLFYLGHKGIEEPFTDLATALTLINFLGKCDLSFEVDEFD